jgi:putative phosphoesterase
MRIGVISDTHGVLHPRVLELFAGVDHILHAGDIGDEDVLRELETIAPVTAVAGNIDGFQLGNAGAEARVRLGDTRFYLTHILDRPHQPLPEVARALRREPADFVIFGHSHLPHDEQIGDIHFFNPASAGSRRFDYPRAVGMFELAEGRWTTRHLGLDARSEEVLARGVHMNQLSRE